MLVAASAQANFTHVLILVRQRHFEVERLGGLEVKWYAEQHRKGHGKFLESRRASRMSRRLTP
jgi:hypothetical protein